MARKILAQTIKLRNVCDTPEPRRNLQEDRPLPAPSFFFHPDCHCRLRSCTESALRLVGYTTGRDLHPALKILIQLFCGVFPDMPCRSSKQFLQTLAKEKPRTPGSGRDNGAQRPLRNKKTLERTHSRAVIQHARADTAPCAFCLLSSRLYCRLRNRTESCLAARGLYHR